jgi:phosphoglycolate phosphatase
VTQPTIDAVLFDLDGTLVDSAPDLAGAVDRMRVARGLPSLPYETYRPLVGAGARGMIGAAFGIKPEDEGFEELKDEFLNNYERCLLDQTRAFEGIAELIAALLARGLAWGVVTNKFERFTLPIVQGMPLLQGAGAIVGGDTTPHSKPHPAPLLEAARRMGLEPTRCVYVGDDERDIIAGKAAGMYTVAATYGYLGVGSVSAWGAHAEIASPLDLLSLPILKSAA